MQHEVDREAVVAYAEDPMLRRARRDRMAGVAMMSVGAVAVVAAVAGMVAALRFIDVLTDQADATLGVTEQAVAAVADTIGLAQDTLPVVAGSLETVTMGVADASGALDDISALLDEAAGLTGEDIPQSIGAIRDTMPGLIRSSELITRTLNALSFLGIEFDPEPTLADSVRGIDAGLTSMSTRLAEGSTLIGEVAGDVVGFGETADAIATDLVSLESTLNEATVLLDTYAATADDAAELVATTRSGLEDQSSQLRVLVILIGIALAAGQLAPIYLGWRLVDDARTVIADVVPVTMVPASEVREPSGEDADATWSHGEADDDEHDPPQNLSPKQGEDA